MMVCSSLMHLPSVSVFSLHDCRFLLSRGCGVSLPCHLLTVARRRMRSMACDGVMQKNSGRKAGENTLRPVLCSQTPALLLQGNYSVSVFPAGGGGVNVSGIWVT